MPYPVDVARTPSEQAPAPKKRDAGSLVAQIMLALWMPTVALGVGSLMVGHWAPMPSPSTGESSRLQRALRELVAQQHPRVQGREHAATQWKLVHVLYGDCTCSAKIADYLMESARPSQADEWVILVDGEPDGGQIRALESKGLKGLTIGADDLYGRFGIDAAPLFIALDPASQVQFAGGYTARKQGLGYKDVATLDALLSGTTPAPIPIFGCGVSDSLQASLDPLNLKY